jgi:hypothetical protein
VTAPEWWEKAHPEECCLFSNGQRGRSSVASQLWRDESGADLRKLIAHLRQGPYADRIIGYLFYSGYTAEWQMWGTWTDGYGDDYSPPALNGFRQWLRARYGTDQALQQAWADPALTFDDAAMPTYERRMDAGPFIRDPATDRQVTDYNRYICDATADSILHFARAAKEACGGTQLAGTYYGYLAAHGARQQLCGHNALTRVLDSPDIDLLMSPNMYANRQLGGTSTFMSATESVKLHGKTWLDESDLRTFLSDPGSGFGRTDTAQQSVAVTWREFANVLTRRASVAWYDMDGTWYADPAMWDTYRRQLRIANEALHAREPFHGDVALLIGDASNDYYRASDLTRLMVGNMVCYMPQVGAAWDCYLLSDIAQLRLPDYRLYIVSNAVAMDDATRQALVDKARRTGATILYVYAPGYVTATGLSPAHLAATTGMAVRVEPQGGLGLYRVDPACPLTAGIDPTGTLGPDAAVQPRIVIDDPAAEVIARYAEGGGVAIARKTVDGVPTLYCAAPAVAPELLRELARSAGAHIYCETGDGIYTDGEYLAIHTAKSGDKTLCLPVPRRWTDVVTGQCLAESTDALTRFMNQGETLLVHLTP